MSKVIKIVRTNPRGGVPEEAVKNRKGKYTLGDPADGSEMRLTKKNGIFADTLDEAADLIENKRFSIRMGRKGIPPSLISHLKVRILR